MNENLRKIAVHCRGHVNVNVSEERDQHGRGFMYDYITLEQGRSLIEISRDDIPKLIDALERMGGSTRPQMTCGPAPESYIRKRERCDRPPRGWVCFGDRDHLGPCAAWCSTLPSAIMTWLRTGVWCYKRKLVQAECTRVTIAEPAEGDIELNNLLITWKRDEKGHSETLMTRDANGEWKPLRRVTRVEIVLEPRMPARVVLNQHDLPAEMNRP